MDYTEDERVKDATIKALTSGALSGAIFGAGAKMLASKSPAKMWEILKTAGLGAGLTGGLAGGSAYIGNSALGAPGDDEPSGYTRRGALGGAVGGGVLGSALGALVSRKGVPLPKAAPHFAKAMVERLRKMPSGKGLKWGAGVGALGAGTAGAAVGADEGMSLDLLANELRDAERKRMLRERYGL